MVSKTIEEYIRGAIYGLAVGDAFGFSYEYIGDTNFNTLAPSEMGYAYPPNAPSGTWTDDTSLTLALMDAITSGFSYECVAKNMMAWYYDGQYSPFNGVVGIGRSTLAAMERLKRSGKIIISKSGVNENGNGSLMRIAPLAFFLKNEAADYRREVVFNISAITHAHIRAKLGCWFYIEVLCNVTNGHCKDDAVLLAREIVERWAHENNETQEWAFYKRCRPGTDDTIFTRLKNASGYVVATLESALYIFLNADCYWRGIQTATALGGDTDTRSSIAGALLGAYYGFSDIPDFWLGTLQRKDIIEKYVEKFSRFITSAKGEIGARVNVQI